MALLDIITQAGGAAAFEQIGARVGLTPAQTRAAAAALLPALAGGLKRQAGNPDLGAILGRTGLDPGSAPTANTTSMGNQILGQIFGSKDVSRTVATNAADTTGIGADKLKALLPLLAALSVGALAARSASAGGQGGLNGMLGMLDQDGDGPMDDILGMVGKFLGR